MSWAGGSASACLPLCLSLHCFICCITPAYAAADQNDVIGIGGIDYQDHIAPFSSR